MNMKVDKFLCAHGKKYITAPAKGEGAFSCVGVSVKAKLLQYEKKALPLHKTVIWGTIQHCIL